MSDSLTSYKKFIDGMVDVAKGPSPLAAALREGRPLFVLPSPEERTFNQLANELSAEQKAVLADLLEKERANTVHGVLAFMTWRKYHLSQEGVELDEEPFGTENFYDFVCRLDGDSWPDEDEKDSE